MGSGGTGEEGEGPGSSLMTAKELAAYLRLNERTVLKLAAQGELPGVRLGNQWRFRKGVVDAWLDDEMLGVHRRTLSQPRPSAPPTFDFDDAFDVSHVIPALREVELSRVLEELAGKAAELGLVRDKRWFLGALLERENVLSSSPGDGVAFPHTLHRHPEHVAKPFLVFARSQAGVDFRAPDGAPVHLVMLMGLRFEELHLPWLSRLSVALRQKPLRDQLLSAPDAGEIHALLRQHLWEQDEPVSPSVRPTSD